MVKAKKRVKKTKAKVARPKLKKKSARAGKKAVRPKKVTPPKIVGKVTHYFPHVKAGVILVTKGTLSLGDSLQIKGYTTNFKQKVTSMQINNAPIKEAKVGDEVGLLVKSRVRHNDVVYKLK